MINSMSELANGFWENGRLSDCPILDFHAHMDSYGGGYLPKKSAEEILTTKDSTNTVLTCFCGHENLFNPAYDKERDIKVALKYPDRYKAYFAVASKQSDVDSDLQLYDKYSEALVGFKFHNHFYKIALSDPCQNAYWEYADRHRLFVLAHTWSGSPYNGIEEVEKILKKYPDIVFIAGHSIYGEWEGAARLARQYPNFYLELTAVLHLRGAVDYLVEKSGSEKILFGTDLPWFSTYHGIGALLSAKIGDDDRRNIFYRNGQKLLKRFCWYENLHIEEDI
ncbi:MAG: amidohydrolase family protein, partial [Clostridiales bacterium]|nr:amidohydrolase family protein [Clostridiales bacterium]